MHRHDLDLIAAYADGSLEGDTGEARRLVDGCDQCRAEYELQTQVRDILGSVPIPRMTGEEKMRVRTAVFEDIGRGAEVVDLASRRTRRWMTIGSVAAAFLVVVGLTGALVQLRGGLESSDGGGIAVLSESDEEATEGAETQLMVPSQPEATTTTAMAEAAADLARAAVTDLGEVSVQELTQAIESAIATAERAAPGDLQIVTESIPGCLQELTDPAVGTIRATLDGDDVVVYVVQTSDGFVAEGFVVSGCVSLNLD